MNYFDRPIQEVKWPANHEPFPLDWPHDIWFTHDARSLSVTSPISREHLVRWLAEHRSELATNLLDTDMVGNFVRINMWSRHIRNHGIIKPILLHDRRGQLEVAVGGSRLMAIESYAPDIVVPAFVSCRRDQSPKYQHMIQIKSFNAFAQTCSAATADVFFFRWSHPTAEFALDWYEHDTARTKSITPDIAQCAEVFRRYLHLNPGHIDHDWFDLEIDWSQYEMHHSRPPLC